MMDMIYARWLLLKRQLPKILLWLIFPLVATIIVTAVYNSTSDDFRVPAAVVVNEQSAEAEIFTEELASSKFMNVEVFDAENSAAAIRQLEQYSFDSVFILPENFDERIQAGQRRNLIETYYTDRSIYYEPAKELAAAIIQERMGEYAAVNYVLELQNNMLFETAVSAEDIASERQRIENETNLVEQSFYFFGETKNNEQTTNLNPWMVWAYIALAVTIFTFDFVTRETVSSARIRFNFMKHSYKQFMILTFIIMTAVMLIIDLITYMLINEMLAADIDLLSLVLYRFIINGAAFLLASLMKSPMKLYQSAVALTFLLLALQLAMPIIVSVTGKPVITKLHPVEMLIENQLNIPWVILLIILTLIWVWRGNNAGS